MREKLFRGIITVFLVFFAWQSNAQENVLLKVGQILREGHYLHPQIDDTFSSTLWESYLQRLDPGKRIFLQQDIDSLEKYKLRLDDEIRGETPFIFFSKVIGIYKVRYEETASIWRNYLNSPILLSAKSMVHPSAMFNEFPKTEAERKKRWQQLLLVDYLQKYNTVKLQLENRKPSESIYKMKDDELATSTRQKVLKQKDLQLTRFHKESDETRLAVYINSVALNADPHTEYFSYIDKQTFDQNMSNRFFGIGIQLKEDENGNVAIQGIDQAGSAWKNGIFSVGDVIIGIGEGENGQIVDVEGLGTQETAKMIRGKQGSIVRMQCRKNNGKVVVTNIVRQEIKLQDAFASSAIVQQQGKKIGYINLPTFYDDFSKTDGAHCADDVERELKKLIAQNIDGLVIDLRYNGGGSLGQVIKMVGLFIGKGPVVQVRNNNGQIQALASDRSEALYKGPLSILVNEWSASASEIFAAAIQDYQRGIIIGSQTLGKGTVQRTLNLGAEKEGALKLTIQKFYRINGGSTQIKGVIPDIELPDASALLDIREASRPKALDWDRIQASDYSPVFDDLNDRITEYNNYLKTQKSWMTFNTELQTLLEQKENDKENAITEQAYIKMLGQRSQANSKLTSLSELPPSERLSIEGAKASLAIKLVKDPYLNEAVQVLCN